MHRCTARNIMAGSAYITRTGRTWNKKTRDFIAERLSQMGGRIGSAYGASIQIEYTPGNPAVVNDKDVPRVAAQAIDKTLGEEALASYHGTLSGEDFSEYLRRVPGVLAFVGTRNPKIGATYAQHSCFYKIDESVLAKGSMVAAQYAIDFLAEPTQEELDGPAITAVAETNPDLAAKLRSAKATTAEARDAIHDARTARHAAIKGIHDARAAARREEKHDE